jgi:(S)-ureidoglycine aminohydrolase
MFALRKLLPQTSEYIFNMHVMDFQPGEHLVVHEVHYNAHGLLMLQGQGVYRLNQEWFSVKAGDAIWMAPYVPQWFGALGRTPARYVLYKDTTLDPLQGGGQAHGARGGVACASER